MARRPIQAPRQVNTDTTRISSNGAIGTPPTSIISFTPSLAATGGFVQASALTTYTSYTTYTTFVTGGTTKYQASGSVVVVANPAELSSLSAAGAFNTSVSSSTTANTTGSGTANAAASTTSAASAHKSSSSKGSTLIPAIVVPVVVVLLLASFGAFFFFMRRRHHRALEEEAKFEKAKPSTSRSLPVDNSSRRNLIPPGAVPGQSADDKPKLKTNVQVTPLPHSQAMNPPRPRRPEEKEIPRSAIGVARSTSSASAVPAKPPSRPPRSAHEMRGLPTNPRPTNRGPRSPYLSGGDIIDSYADMRPSTAPNGGGRGPSPPSKMDMRTPLPVKPMGRPPPKNPNPPPPPYVSQSAGQSPSSRTGSPALWPASSQAQSSSALSRAQAGTPDSSYGLTEENLRIARLKTGSNSSLGMARYAPDNTSISDVDEHDQARAQRDDVSDISELDEEQERMASPMGTGRGTPMSGRVGTPLSGRGYVR